MKFPFASLTLFLILFLSRFRQLGGPRFISITSFLSIASLASCRPEVLYRYFRGSHERYVRRVDRVVLVCVISYMYLEYDSFLAFSSSALCFLFSSSTLAIT